MCPEQKQEVKMQHTWAEAKRVVHETPEHTTQREASNAESQRKGREEESKKKTAQ